MSRVSVANPYDLLADENEDRTNVAPPKPKEQKPKAPAAPATTAKPAAKPADKPKAAAPAAATKAAPSKPQQAGGQSPAPRDANTNLEEKQKEYRPRGQGGDKRDRPSKLPVGRDNKSRPFDRKSGTGRPANESKKGGQGGGNWGAVDTKEVAEALKEAEAKPDDKEPAEGEEKVTADGEKKEGEEGEKKEGEEGEKKEDKPAPPPELGLDEYLAKLKKKAPQVEAFKPRTVSTEGFEGLTQIAKDEEDGLAPTAGKKAKKDGKKPAAKKEVKEKDQDASNLLAFPTWQEISAQQRRTENREKYGNPRPPREGGDRDRRPPRDGQRGPRRDNSNRGPSKDAAPAQAAPASSQKDFPSLAPVKA
jgi:hypothetical protein